MYFFLFKQKTAYEMRISDWSSDVCSSDLKASPSSSSSSSSAFLRKFFDFLAPAFISCARKWGENFARSGWPESASARRQLLARSLRRPEQLRAIVATRSEESRVGKECVRTCRFRW